MKKILKVVVIMICSFLALPFICQAEPYNGKIYKAEVIDDIYFYKHREDTADKKYPTHNFYEQAQVYRRSTDNQYVYCIESWTELDGASEGDYTESLKYVDTLLTKAQATRISLLAYYGYGYKEKGYDHSDKKWYAITQYLIWTTQNPTYEHYFVGALHSKDPIYPYEKEIKELNDLVTKHSLKPSFSGKTTRMKIFDTTSVEDTNNVLNDYEIVSYDKEGIDVTKQGNKIIIKGKKIGNYRIKLSKTTKRFATDNVYYISKDYQDCVAVGNYEPINVELPVRVSGNTVKINKYGEVIEELEITSTGVNLKKTNKLINGAKVELYAAQDIFDGNGDYIYHLDEMIMEMEIPEECYVELAPGKYYFKEISTIYPYAILQEKQSFDLSDGDTSIEIYNKYQKVKLELMKIGDVIKPSIDGNLIFKKEPLANIKIGIYAAESIPVTDGMGITKDTLVDILTTDASGKISYIGELPYGKYYLKEIATDDRYILDDTKYPFEFQYDASLGEIQKIDIQLTKTNELDNYLKLKDVIIKKIDEETHNPLGGITFAIYDESKENKIFEGITNDDGILSVSLPIGTYYIREIATLEGYILDDTWHEMIIDDKEEEFFLELTNKKIPEVPVPKTDKVNYHLLEGFSLISILLGIRQYLWRKR